MDLLKIDDNLSRKEREKLFRKNEILNAAVKLFARKGYDNTTLDEIAELSEFGKGTLYNYFENKEEIYFTILELLFKNHLETVKRISSDAKDLMEYVSRLTREMIDFCVNNKDAFLLLVKLRLDIIKESDTLRNLGGCNNDIMDISVGQFQKAIDRGEIKPYNPESLVTLLKNLVLPYIHNLIFIKKLENIDPEKETKFLTEVMFQGILKSKG